MSVLVIILFTWAGLSLLATVLLLTLLAAAGRADWRTTQIIDRETEGKHKLETQAASVEKQYDAPHLRKSRYRSTQSASNPPVSPPPTSQENATESNAD